MSLKIDNPNSNVNKDHRSNVETIKKRNELELEKLSINHKKNKAAMKSQSQEEIIDLKHTGNEQKLDMIQKKNEVLGKLKGQIGQIQKIHKDQQTNLDETHNARMNEKKITQDHTLRFRAKKNQDDLNEQNETANIQIKQLRRAYQKEHETLKNHHTATVRNDKSLSKTEVEGQKQRFRHEQSALQDKYSRSLNKLKSEGETQIARQEQSHQLEQKKKQVIFNDTTTKTESDHEMKIDTENKNFEEKYSNLHEKHETLLKNLNENKKHLIQNYKNDIYNEVSALQERSDDTFYSIPDISPKITENSRTIQMSFDIPKDQADYFTLTGNSKELKLSMSRRFNDKVTYRDGSSQVVAKTETVSKKIPTDSVVEPRSITKVYENGKLHFTVQKA